LKRPENHPGGKRLEGGSGLFGKQKTKRGSVLFDVKGNTKKKKRNLTGKKASERNKLEKERSCKKGISRMKSIKGWNGDADKTKGKPSQ